MTRQVHLRVIGRLDTGRVQEGTVTIRRDLGLVEVRPLRRRRSYILPLSAVAEMVVSRVVRAELAERAKTKRLGRAARRSAR